MLPAFMLTPLFKWGAGIVGALALIAAIWFGIQHAINKHDQGIRDELIAQQQIEALQNAARQAEADRKFEQMIEERKTQDALALDEIRRSNQAAVAEVKKNLRARIQSGELADREVSPLIVSTVDEIERLKAEREKKQ